jgi:hypothetical protein
MPSEEEKQACLQRVPAGRGSDVKRLAAGQPYKATPPNRQTALNYKIFSYFYHN